MKTASALTAGPDRSTLFQTAARLEIPGEKRVARLEPPVTRETFACLRLEAAAINPKGGSGGRNSGALTHLPVSFEIVRQTVISHTLERQTKIGEISRQSNRWM